jgi:hypothetical protein
MPTVTWARLDPIRRAAVVEPPRPSSVPGFSQGSLNVIAQRAGLREVCSSTSRTSETCMRSSPTSAVNVCVLHGGPHPPARRQPAIFEFLTDLLDSWVAYFADHPRERSLHAAASLEVDTDARISVRTVIHRHYLEVLRPLVRAAHERGDLCADADTDALLSLLLLIFPHLALAPYVRGIDPILGLDEPTFRVVEVGVVPERYFRHDHPHLLPSSASMRVG